MDLIASGMTGLNQQQQASTRQFCALRGYQRFRVQMRMRSRELLQNWHLLQSMPSPTLPAFPLYDCHWHPESRVFKTIEEILSLDDPQIQIHHRKRVRGWSHVSRTTPDFAEPEMFETMFTTQFKFPHTYINARDHQAVQSIAELREWEAGEKRYDYRYNHEYTFELYPSSYLDEDPFETGETFYAGLAITIRSDDIDMEQSFQLPALGTSVSAKLKTPSQAQSREETWS